MALPLMERMLGWNLDDNQGVFYVIGSQYLRASNSAKAQFF